MNAPARSEHYMCEICDAEAGDSDAETAFRSIAELDAHMLHMHRIVTSSRSRAAQFLTRPGLGGDKGPCAFVDMDFTSSDPNMLWRGQHQGRGAGSGAGAFRGTGDDDTAGDTDDFLVPSNM